MADLDDDIPCGQVVDTELGKSGHYFVVPLVYPVSTKVFHARSSRNSTENEVTQFRVFSLAMLASAQSWAQKRK